MMGGYGGLICKCGHTAEEHCPHGCHCDFLGCQCGSFEEDGDDA